MRVFSTILCLVAAASFDVTKAEEIAILEDTPEARLIKDHDPIAEATYHESDPVVQDAVGSDNLPRLVRNRGPLTKKVVASGSHFPGLDFSLVAWKFADGSFKGTMEEKLDNGEVLVKVDVDCLDVQNGRAIVGGTISKTNRKSPDAFLYKRAHSVIVDEGLTEEVSGLLVGLPEDVDCSNLTKSVDHGNVQMHPGSATVCNRRDGEAAWLDCVDSLKKTE